MKKQYTKKPAPALLSRRLGRLLLTALLVFRAFSLQAQTTWTGTTSTDWVMVSNWSAGVPDAADDVTIPNLTPSPILSTTAVAKSVQVQSGASLSIAAEGTSALLSIWYPPTCDWGPNSAAAAQVTPIEL